MTAPQPSPFTPNTNFNKVDLSASPAQQQRQGVSSEKADEIGKALRHLLKSLRGAKALGIEERSDYYEHGLEQLRKWRGLTTAYLAFFDRDNSSSIGNLDKRTLNARLFNIVNSNKPDVARYGDNLNITVPLNELVDSMEQPNFDVDTLVAKWVNLKRNVKRLHLILEKKGHKTAELERAKVQKALDEVYGG